MNSVKHQCVAAVARLREIPALERFHSVVTPVLSSGDDAAFLQCKEEFSMILCPEFVTAIINHELQSFASNPFYIPDEAGEHSLTLVHTADYSLELWIVPSNVPLPQFVRSSAAHCMFGLVSAGPSTIQMFCQPKPLPNNLFDRNRQLHRAGQVELSQGQATCVRAGFDCFLIQPAPEEQVYLFFRSRPVLRLIWEYSSSGLEPVKLIAADKSACRIQFAARLLASMSYDKAIPGLVRLMEHPDHFVRWTAVQSILALDLKEGLHSLEMAEKDNHPHVRNAAAKALRLVADIDQGAA